MNHKLALDKLLQIDSHNKETDDFCQLLQTCSLKTKYRHVNIEFRYRKVITYIGKNFLCCRTTDGAKFKIYYWDFGREKILPEITRNIITEYISSKTFN